MFIYILFNNCPLDFAYPTNHGVCFLSRKMAKKAVQKLIKLHPYENQYLVIHKIKISEDGKP